MKKFTELYTKLTEAKTIVSNDEGITLVLNSTDKVINADLSIRIVPSKNDPSKFLGEAYLNLKIGKDEEKYLFAKELTAEKIGAKDSSKEEMSRTMKDWLKNNFKTFNDIIKGSVETFDENLQKTIDEETKKIVNNALVKFKSNIKQELPLRLGFIKT